MSKLKRVLFVCSGNSCRSQMAEQLLRHLAKGRVEAFSAGTEPRPVNPLAVQAMAEIRLDISRQVSKGPSAFAGQAFDFVITVCDRARQRCPSWPGDTQYIHWSITDPDSIQGTEEARLRAVRIARDELRNRIGLFLLSHHL